MRHGRLSGVLCCHVDTMVQKTTELILGVRREVELDGEKSAQSEGLRAHQTPNDLTTPLLTAPWTPFCRASRRNAAWGRADAGVANRGDDRPKHRGGAQADPPSAQVQRASHGTAHGQRRHRPSALGATRSMEDAARVSRFQAGGGSDVECCEARERLSCAVSRRCLAAMRASACCVHRDTIACSADPVGS